MNQDRLIQNFQQALGASSARIRDALQSLSKQGGELVSGAFGDDVMRSFRRDGGDALDAWETLCAWSQLSWAWINFYDPNSPPRPWKETAGGFQFYLFEVCRDWSKVDRLMRGHGGTQPKIPAAELLRFHDGKPEDEWESEVRRACLWIEAGEAAGQLEFYRLNPMTADPDSVSALIAKGVTALRASLRDGAPRHASRKAFANFHDRLVSEGIEDVPELHPMDPKAKQATLGWVRQCDLWLVRLWPAFQKAKWTATTLSEWCEAQFGQQAGVPDVYKDFGTRLRRLGLKNAAQRGPQGEVQSIPMLSAVEVGGHPCFPPLIRWQMANPTRKP